MSENCLELEQWLDNQIEEQENENSLVFREIMVNQQEIANDFLFACNIDTDTSIMDQNIAEMDTQTDDNRTITTPLLNEDEIITLEDNTTMKNFLHTVSIANRRTFMFHFSLAVKSINPTFTEDIITKYSDFILHALTTVKLSK